MTKGKIIGISITIFVITLIAVLFSAVFCLRQVSVECGDNAFALSNCETIKAKANLQIGKSIFLQDKDTATQNIEQAIPNVKVVQIKTVSVVEIKIVVRQRFAMYYSTFGSNYYILDEELKVLQMFEIEYDGDTPTNTPSEYTYFDAQQLCIGEDTKVCDFVCQGYADITANLFESMYSVVVVGEDEHRAERSDIQTLLKEISFVSHTNANGKKYDRLVLTTRTGSIIEIAEPNNNLTYKINLCFGAYKNNQTDSRIIYDFDASGNELAYLVPITD